MGGMKIDRRMLESGVGLCDSRLFESSVTNELMELVRGMYGRRWHIEWTSEEEGVRTGCNLTGIKLRSVPLCA